MSREKKRQNRQAWIDWVQSRLDDRACRYVNVTLTMKQGVKFGDARLELLTPEAADWNTRNFLNALNRKVLGNSYKRRGRRLRVFDVAEGGDDSTPRDVTEGRRCSMPRAHRHMLIEITPRFTVDEYRNIICKLWRSSRWGYDHIYVKPLESARGSIAYMTKTGLDAIRIGTSTF